MSLTDKYYLRNVQKLRSLFPDFNFTDDALLIINTYGRKAQRAHYVLKIDSELYPYKGQIYVMIGDWVYLVNQRIYKTNNSTYMLYITHALNLENITVDSLKKDVSDIINEL